MQLASYIAPLQPIISTVLPARGRELQFADLDDTIASFVRGGSEIEFEVRADASDEDRGYAEACNLTIEGDIAYALGSSFEAAVRGAQLLSDRGTMGIGDTDAAVALLRAEDGTFVAMNTQSVLTGVGDPVELPVGLLASVSNRDREVVAIVGAHAFADLRH